MAGAELWTRVRSLYNGIKIKTDYIQMRLGNFGELERFRFERFEPARHKGSKQISSK